VASAAVVATRLSVLDASVQPAVDIGGDAATAARPSVSLRLVVLGLLTVCTTLGEGAAADWSGIFLHEDRGASESVAAAAYAAFACAMAAGRFGGTWLLTRMTRVRALRASGLLVFVSIFVLI